MRLFACLRPPTAVLDHLDQALTSVSPPWTGAGPPPVRWVAPDQRHVTLAFYGEVPDGALDELVAALQVVAGAYGPPEVQLAGAGVFNAATLWVGVRAADDRLLPGLMARCAEAGAGVTSLEMRERNRAHLTVARLSGRRQGDQRRSRRRGIGAAGAGAPRPAIGPGVDLPALAHALSVYRGPLWRAESIELVRSQLGAGRSGGPQHEVLARLPFGGSPA